MKENYTIGLSKEDLDICQDWNNDKLNNSNTTTYGGFVCNYK